MFGQMACVLARRGQGIEGNAHGVLPISSYIFSGTRIDSLSL